MEMKYFDSHCHIQFKNFDQDRKEVIAQMHTDEVGGIIVGVDRISSEKAIALATQHTHLYAAVGMHPNIVEEESFDANIYRTLAAHPKVVGIGECGLDYYRPIKITDEVKRSQRTLLSAHIDLAAELDKPLIIHCRPTKGTCDAYLDLIELLKEKKAIYGSAVHGDIHFFVGGASEAEAFFSLDFMVSFTAVITFTHEYDAVIQSAPLNRILSETDSPYVAPATRRYERNDPLSVKDVVARIADIRGEEVEKVREALVTNAKRIFSI